MLIDTHCHLNLADAFPDPAAAIEEAFADGVDALVVVGVDRQTSEDAIRLAETFEPVWAVVGWQPNYANSFEASRDIPVLRSWMASKKVVAIGEIGLDYHWDHATPERQRTCLDAQLDLADELDRPIVFHCRDAYPDLLDVLEARGPGRYLLHCFSGDADHARRAVALGCYFGVDGPIGYPKAVELRSIVRGLPRNRIVVETDSPYLAPVPHRGKPNRPAFVRFVNNALASCLEIDADACATATSDNARRFFGLPG